MKKQGKQMRRWISPAGLLVLAVLTADPTFAQPAPPPVEVPPEIKAEDVRPKDPALTAERPKAIEGVEYTNFKITRFLLGYHREHPKLPTLAELGAIEVELGKTDKGFVAPESSPDRVTIRLGDWVSETGEMFDETALAAISEAIKDELAGRGLISLFVVPHPDDVGEGGRLDQVDRIPAEDLRKETDTALRFQIYTGITSQVRTMASGDRFQVRDKATGELKIPNPLDHPKHARIRNLSPIKQGDLLQGAKLENYAERLSRHPSRSVDLAIAPGSEDVGDVVLDYLVGEAKPWTVYFQLSNTGTESTGEWRQRAGFIHNQLTGHDDILRLDYITASLEDFNAVIGSYEFPLFTDRLRLKIFGQWSEFTASDVGVTGVSFDGTGTRVGAELAYNVFQRRKLFVDLFAGARWDSFEIKDRPATGTPDGDEDFFQPIVGARLLRNSTVFPTFGELAFEWNAADIAGTEDADLVNMRRERIDRDFTQFKYTFEQSIYLEPLLNRRAWRGEEDAPKGLRTIAHEVAFSLRGQETLGTRLPPTEQAVAGGAFTVRGYPEAFVSGDNMILGSIEYRFHVPRALSARPAGKLFGRDFRWRRSQDYGTTDWDLVLKGFYDIADVRTVNGSGSERGYTLQSVGVGGEFAFRSNLILRVDWGFALEGVREGTEEVQSGDNQVHFVGTLLF
jgi:outer membrane protein assembly factor BamA